MWPTDRPTDKAGCRVVYTFYFYKNQVYKNIEAWNRSKNKNIVVIFLVAISISFEGFGQKMTFL